MPPERTVATNRKARHDYHIEESFEAGIVLTGSEIKSVRAGRVNLRDSYAAVRGGELWLINSHIALYDPASQQNHEPRRSRKLLMHRHQINRLEGQVRERGYTLIPLRMYLRDGRAKVELALARGKRKYDKRRTIAEREAGRQIERALKERGRGGAE
ncbi:MAG: SsrA-binding protein SmpB [Chloroflexota bacterium]|nr:SsrA-binding protein SmpB [Chloroflexota bacterium]